jgi:hypothetical protein
VRAKSARSFYGYKDVIIGGDRQDLMSDKNIDTINGVIISAKKKDRWLKKLHIIK